MLQINNYAYLCKFPSFIYAYLFITFYAFTHKNF